jgi:hypothetical protein
MRTLFYFIPPVGDRAANCSVHSKGRVERLGDALCLFCSFVTAANLSTAVMDSVHLSKSNIYQTLVLVWLHSRPGWTRNATRGVE